MRGPLAKDSGLLLADQTLLSQERTSTGDLALRHGRLLNLGLLDLNVAGNKQFIIFWASKLLEGLVIKDWLQVVAAQIVSGHGVCGVSENLGGRLFGALRRPGFVFVLPGARLLERLLRVVL